MHVSILPRVQQIPLPPDALALATLGRVDYSDSFTVEVASTDTRSPLQWARVLLEDAPAAFRRTAPRLWFALGLKHGPVQGPDTVLGWPVRHAGPEYALLGADSRLGMPAELLLWKPDPTQLVFATLIRHGNPAMRFVWAAITPTHQRIVHDLLERAAR